MRLDIYITTFDIAKSREKAKKLIKSGYVKVNNKIIKKPSYMIAESDEVVCEEVESFVGRGALKLEKALDCFEIDLQNKVCADIGASTGGFTDLMLRCGAAKVYSIDVGHGQLDVKLLNDKRVVNMEGINFRNYDVTNINEIMNFISVDVSFISLTHLIPNISELLSDDGSCVLLVKPQFEAGKEAAHRGKGIIKDKKIHKRVLAKVINCAVENNLFAVRGTISPIKGKTGNTEYLVQFNKNRNQLLDLNINTIIENTMKDE